VAKTGLALAILRRSRSSLLGSATAQLGGVAPYHYADFITNRMLYAGADVGNVTQATGYSFTRASDGYYTNSDGTLTLFGSGALRRGDRGVLIEGSRTNLLTYSQEFDNASWTKQRATVTVDAIAAPDGTLTADKLIENADNNTHTISKTISLTAASHTLFVFAKSAERTWISFLNNSATAVAANFDLANGIVGSVGANATATITALANGWYRCAMTFTAVSGNNQFLIRLGTADATPSYQGDGTSGLFIWGAQLEAASFASSYVPTVAAAATRAADVLTYTAGVSYPFSAYAEYVPGGPASSALSFAVATASQQVYIGKDVGAANTNEAQLYVRNTADQAWIRHAAGTANVGATVRQAVRLGTNDFASSVGGSAVLTDTSGTVPTMTTMRVGTDVGNTQFMFGHIRRIAVFNSALTDAQLQTVTGS